MRRLTEIANRSDAAELVRRLNDASLTAFCTDALYLGVGEHPIGRSIIWIGEQDDMTVAARVLDEFRADLGTSFGPKCNRCAHDLRGHAGIGQCPECGWPFQREGRPMHPVTEEARLCAACGEEVPANFERCWNCGERMSA